MKTGWEHPGVKQGWKREGILALKEEYRKGKVCSASAFSLVTEQSGIIEETKTKFKGKT